MTEGASIHVRRATIQDLPSLPSIISQYRERAAEHLDDLFAVEKSHQALLEALQEALADANTAFFLGGLSHANPSAVLWCRHIDSAPPVYQPERSFLSVKPFHTSADEMLIVGPDLLDAATQWSKSISKSEDLLVSCITWAHDPAVHQVTKEFHRTSKLTGIASYHELFHFGDEDARMRPATNWYFSRSQNLAVALGQDQPPSATVRLATADDLPRMVELSRHKRHDYARYQPVFWRPAEDADEKQLAFFGWLLQQEALLLFVSEATDGTLNGFLIALQLERLPLFDPAFRLLNGLHIDDFTVASDDLWATAGRGLLLAAVSAHQERIGTSTTVNVISGTHDLAKRKFLEGEAKMRCLSRWNILPAGNLYTGGDT